MHSFFRQIVATVIITIPEAINEDHVTFYEILVQIQNIKWRVRRRFREFVELHDSLVDHGVDKESLPQKKLLNKDPSFIMKRRRDLESYLQSVFNHQGSKKNLLVTKCTCK